MQYYLQLNEKFNGIHINFRWEEVDEFIYNNWKKCFATKDGPNGPEEFPRYSGNRIIFHTEGEHVGQIDLDLTKPVTKESLETYAVS